MSMQREIVVLRNEVAELKQLVQLMVVGTARKSFFSEGLSCLKIVSQWMFGKLSRISISFGWKDVAIAVGIGVYMAPYVKKTVGFLWAKWPIVRNGTLPVSVSTDIVGSGRVFESRRPNSEECKLTPPRFQFSIGTVVEGKFVVHGCGIRLDDWLVIPDHVYSCADTAMVKVSNGKYVDLKTHDLPYVIVDTDVIVLDCRNHSSLLSMMGLSKPVIQHEIPRAGMLVSIVGPVGMGTTGILRWVEDSFGAVEYSGTTLPGYSGAAYCKGERVVGIHTHGGAVNGGLSISYLYATIKYEFKVFNESTEDFLLDRYRAGDLIVEDKNWPDLDTARIAIGTRVTIVERDSIKRAFGKNYESFVKQGSLSTRKTKGDEYQDYEADFRLVASTSKMPESLVSPLSDELLGSVSSERLSLINKLSQLSPKKLREIRLALNSCVAAPSTAGQVLTPDKN